MNWQSCHNMIFVGLSDSFEEYFQAVRRCYRFGQKHPVNVYIISSHQEGAVLKNIQRKEQECLDMINNMVELTKQYVLHNVKNCDVLNDKKYEANVKMIVPEWLKTEEN